MALPLIVLTGPTAVGKTDLSIALARSLGGEIISADSMQVYRHMDIGSAKVTKEETGGIPHHLIDVLDPWEEFNVVVFQRMAKEALSGIFGRGHIPIVAGGTGFYIQSLVYDIDFTANDSDPALRRFLEQEAALKGPDHLHRMLAAVDPDAARQIHANNVKRVIRALEFFALTGEPISAHNASQRQKESPYLFAYFVLNDDRKLLYQRIDQRVEEMLSEGLVEEVQRLRDMGCTRDMGSMQGLGYKEILDYLEGRCTLEESVYVLKRDTRHFAKRQLTWFKRERDVLWLDKREYGREEEQILSAMGKLLRERGICKEFQERLL